MRRWRSIRPAVVSVAVAVVAVAILSGAVPVTADTALNHMGQYGRHYLADTEEYPEARCRYDADNNLDRIRVLEPTVFSASNDPDRRSVSWRVLVQKNGGHGFVTVKKSNWQFAEARTTRPADFAPISVSLIADTDADYRVLVRMGWWTGGKELNLTGSALHRVDWYRYPLADANQGFCPSFIL
jgi:hypothetical protein